LFGWYFFFVMQDTGFDKIATADKEVLLISSTGSEETELVGFIYRTLLVIRQAR
jgi:hypothetical protein